MTRPKDETVLLHENGSVRYVVRKWHDCDGNPHHDVWEPCGSLMTDHSTLTSGLHEQSTWWGQVGSRPLPRWLDDLPAMSAQRSEAVGNWHESQYHEAYAAILAAFPEHPPYTIWRRGEAVAYRMTPAKPETTAQIALGYVSLRLAAGDDPDELFGDDDDGPAIGEVS
jgi:hypothetical protein